MMRILSIDTSTPRANVALLEESAGRVETVTEVAQVMVRSHATQLFGLIDRVLSEAAWSKQQLDGFAVVRGPGSFTGIRIALGTVQGLALASGQPSAGVNTLEAMAEASGPCPAERLPVLGAGRGDVYVARYDADSSPPHELVAPHIQTAESFWETAPGCALWGSGAQPAISLPSGRGREAGLQTAAAAGRIAIFRGFTSEADNLMAPLYIRPPDAELKRPRN